jgi:hypothetical protein
VRILAALLGIRPAVWYLPLALLLFWLCKPALIASIAGKFVDGAGISPSLWLGY